MVLNILAQKKKSAYTEEEEFVWDLESSVCCEQESSPGIQSLYPHTYYGLSTTDHVHSCSSYVKDQKKC